MMKHAARIVGPPKADAHQLAMTAKNAGPPTAAVDTNSVHIDLKANKPGLGDI